VTNVTRFGAFVDIGVHQDGLIHISQLANAYVQDPSEIVSVGDVVRVKVLEVDQERRRIALSRKQASSG
jgi:protein Tex